MRKALVVSDKRVVVVRDDVPERILTVIPTAKRMLYKGVELVVVPHMLDETIVLNNMGYEIPSPVTQYYGWPSRYPSPLHAQVVTTSNLTTSKRHFVLNDLGTGKTLSTLWAFDYLRSVGHVKSMLVVTPLSTMETVWANEMWEHLPHLQYQVIYGSAAKRVGQLAFPADVYIINHDGLKVPEVLKALLARKDIDVLCVDELADFKNASTDRWKALSKLAVGRKYFWGLTGTPIPNKVTDAWGQCRLVSPNNVPVYFGKFRDLVMRQVSQFKWVPRDNALEIVKDAMQPATLFRRDECIDLPPTMYVSRYVPMTEAQNKAYKQMMNSLVAEAGQGKIVAVNEAVKMGKLVQVACLAKDTPVLCGRGWVPIQAVTLTDIVWDGEEWVSHSGCIRKGVRSVINCGGVSMTPEHEVLTTAGWKPAQEINNGNAGKRFGWYDVRVPNCFSESRLDVWVGDWKGKVREVAMQVSLWSRDNTSKSEHSNDYASDRPTLRVHELDHKYEPWHVAYSAIQYLGAYAQAVQDAARSRLAELWWAWNNSVRKMERVVSEFLVGYAVRLLRYADIRTEGQQWWIRQKELPVGNYAATVQQQEVQCAYTHSSRKNDSRTGGEALWTKTGDDHSKNKAVRVERRKSCDNTTDPVDVFDLVNCGPRNRFVVRGRNGELRIVHNCGAAYGPDGEVLYIDSHTRMEELKRLIEESQGKVIIFIPLTGGLHSVADELSKTWKTEVVHGGVSKNERVRIFGDFKSPGGVHVIVAHPRCMCHGLTLVSANTIIWYIPTNNPNEYTQANGRITRPGQTRSTFIVHLEGSEVERRMYKKLKDKEQLQGTLLDLVKEGMDK